MCGCFPSTAAVAQAAPMLQLPENHYASTVYKAVYRKKWPWSHLISFNNVVHLNILHRHLYSLRLFEMTIHADATNTEQAAAAPAARDIIHTCLWNCEFVTQVLKDHTIIQTPASTCTTLSKCKRLHNTFPREAYRWFVSARCGRGATGGAPPSCSTGPMSMQVRLPPQTTLPILLS